MRIRYVQEITQGPIGCSMCELDRAETAAKFRDSRAIGFYHMLADRLPVNLPLCRFHAAQAGAGTLDLGHWTRPRRGK